MADDTAAKWATAQAKLKLTKKDLDYQVTQINQVKSEYGQAAAQVTEQYLREVLGDYKRAYMDFMTLSQTAKLTESQKVTVAEESGRYEAITDVVVHLLVQLREMSVDEERAQKATEKQRLPIRLPELKISSFENNEADPLSFQKFSLAFKNALLCYSAITEDQKLLFLRTVLKGNSLSLVAGQTDFDAAWRLLNNHFYEPDHIIEVILAPVIDQSALPNLSAVSEYFTTLRFKLQELDSLDVPYQAGDLGCRMLSKIIRDKLPGYVQQELARRTKTNYPSVELIMAHIEDIIRMYSAKLQQKKDHAQLTKKPVVSGPQSGNSYRVYDKHKNSPSYASLTKAPAKAEMPKAVALAVTKTAKTAAKSEGRNKYTPKKCKFCNNSEHTTSNCNNYGTLTERVARAEALNKCTSCLTDGHHKNTCTKQVFPFTCTKCGENTHIQPFCPKTKQ